MNCPQMPTLQIMLIGQLLMLELMGQIRHFGLFVLSSFYNCFPVDSFDGPLYANKNQVSHPTIDEHLETVDPNQQSMFSSSDLNSLKSMRKLTKKLKNQGTAVSKRKPWRHSKKKLTLMLNLFNLPFILLILTMFLGGRRRFLQFHEQYSSDLLET